MEKNFKITNRLSGGSFPEVRCEVSDPVPPWNGGVWPRQSFIRGSVGLRRGRLGEAVLQRPAWTHLQQQALPDVPPDLPMWAEPKRRVFILFSIYVRIVLPTGPTVWINTQVQTNIMYKYTGMNQQYVLIHRYEPTVCIKTQVRTNSMY